MVTSPSKNSNKIGNHLGSDISIDELELTKELDRLVTKTGYGAQFELVIDPVSNSTVEGEVVGNRIIIHSLTMEQALRTIRHEFIDAAVVEAIRPYEQLANLQRASINAMLKQIQDGAYTKKEQVVESLMRLIE